MCTLINYYTTTYYAYEVMLKIVKMEGDRITVSTDLEGKAANIRTHT